MDLKINFDITGTESAQELVDKLKKLSETLKNFQVDNLTEEINRAEASFAALGNQISKVNQKDKEGQQTLKSKIELMQMYISDLKALKFQEDLVSKSEEELAKTINNVQKGIDKCNRSILDLTYSMEASGKVSSKNQKDLETQNRLLDIYQKQLVISVKYLQENVVQIEKSSTAYGELKSALSGLTAMYDENSLTAKEDLKVIQDLSIVVSKLGKEMSGTSTAAGVMAKAGQDLVLVNEKIAASNSKEIATLKSKQKEYKIVTGEIDLQTLSDKKLRDQQIAYKVNLAKYNKDEKAEIDILTGKQAERDQKEADRQSKAASRIAKIDAERKTRKDASDAKRKQRDDERARSASIATKNAEVAIDSTTSLEAQVQLLTQSYKALSKAEQEAGEAEFLKKRDALQDDIDARNERIKRKKKEVIVESSEPQVAAIDKEAERIKLLTAAYEEQMAIVEKLRLEKEENEKTFFGRVKNALKGDNNNEPLASASWKHDDAAMYLSEEINLRKELIELEKDEVYYKEIINSKDTNIARNAQSALLETAERRLEVEKEIQEIQNSPAKTKGEKIAQAERERINVTLEGNKKIEESHEQAAKKSTGYWEQFGNIFERMGLRMLASMIWFEVIAQSAMAIWEWWTKIDDATQRALDRAKDYFDSFESFQKKLQDDTPDTVANITTKKEKANLLIADMRRVAKNGDEGMEKAFNKYQELLQLFPKIFDALDKKAFKEQYGNERMESQIKTMDKYNQLLEVRAGLEGELQTSNVLIEKNKSLQLSARENIVKGVKDGAAQDAVKDVFSDNFYEMHKKSDAEIKAALNKMSDDEIVAAVQKEYKGKVKDQTFWSKLSPQNLGYKSDAQMAAEQLNAFEDEQKINVGNKANQITALKVVQPQITDLEGNTKDPRGSQRHPADKTMEDYRKEEEILHQEQIIANKKKYDESGKSFDDLKKTHEQEIIESKLHYETLTWITDEYRDHSKKTDLEISNLHKEDLKNKHKENEETARESADALLKFKEDNEKKLQEIKDFNDKQSKAADEFNRKIEDIAIKNQKQDIDSKKNKRVGWLSAFFGLGGGTPQKDFEDDIKKRDLDIDLDKSRLFGADLERNKKQDAFEKASEAFDADKATPANLRTKYENDRYNKDKSLLDKASGEKEAAEGSYQSADDKTKGDIQARQDAIDEKRKRENIQIAQTSYDAVGKIANAAFDAQMKRIKMQQDATTAMYAMETTLAGNNSIAKDKIARTEHTKMLALKREEAQTQKNQAIFAATTNMAQGITKAYADNGFPANTILAALIAATDLAQIAEISSTPLPQYKKGRKGGRKEKALINEEGFELTQSQDGKFKVFGGGKEGVAQLEQGDTVYTHKESLNILKTNNFMQDLLKGTGVYMEKEKQDRKLVILQPQLSKADMKEAFSDAIKNMPTLTVTLPAQDVQSRYESTAKRNL